MILPEETIRTVIGKQSDRATTAAPAITGQTMVRFNHPAMQALFTFVIWL